MTRTLGQTILPAYSQNHFKMEVLKIDVFYVDVLLSERTKSASLYFLPYLLRDVNQGGFFVLRIKE